MFFAKVVGWLAFVDSSRMFEFSYRIMLKGFALLALSAIEMTVYCYPILVFCSLTY